MHPRIVVGALATLLTASSAAHAQTVFVAPSFNNISGRAEEGFGNQSTHVLFVENHSTVAIIVFGFALHDCENLRQSCESRMVNVRVPAGQQREVARVSPRDDRRSFNYRWSYSYHADSSDAEVLAILREHGLDLQGQPSRASMQRMASTDTISAERAAEMMGFKVLPGRMVTRVSPDVPPERPSDAAIGFKFKVFYGSVLGSTMMPGAPIQRTGPCVNPATQAKYERDTHIARTPWRPPVAPSNLGVGVLGPRVDTISYSGDVLMRWAADTSGATIPESVTVLESSDPELSVGLCKAVIGTKVTPARDKSGQLIAAWIQLPVTVRRFRQASPSQP